MLRHFVVFFLLISPVIFCDVARGEEQNCPPDAKTSAYQLFHQGKVRQAITALQALLPSLPTPAEKALLQRDLLEVCAFAYDWECVGKTIQEIVPLSAPIKIG